MPEEHPTTAVTNTKFFIVVKNVVMTRFLQDADMFESFKFVGRIREVSGHLVVGPEDALRKMAAKGDDSYMPVGLIVPGGEALFFEGYKVYSDGTHWAPLHDVCRRFEATLRFVTP